MFRKGIGKQKKLMPFRTVKIKPEFQKNSQTHHDFLNK